jgi:hypothetical protein
LEEARSGYEDVRGARQRVLGPEHPSTLDSLLSVAEIDLERGLTDQALKVCSRVLAVQRRVLPRGHADLAGTLICAGTGLNRQARFREAQADLEEAINIAGAESYEVARAKSLLGESLAGQRAFPRAEPWLLAGHDELARDPMAPTRWRRDAAQRLVALYDAWGKPEKAKEWRAKLATQASPEPSPAGLPAPAAPQRY